MPSFEILADIFTCLSVFDSPKGSSNTVKTRKKYQPVFHNKAPNCCRELKRATAHKGDKCSIFSGEKKLFGTNEIAVKQDQ